MRWLAIALVCAWTGCHRKATTQIAGAGGAPVQVVAVDVTRQSVSETLPLVGSLAAQETVEIKSEADGTVELINFREGQRVEQGDLLIQLDQRKLAPALAESEANFKLSQSTYERGKELFHDQLISQQEFDQASAQYQASQASLELKRQQLRDTRIVAPFAGIVGARQVSPGQVISKNTTLTWLVDMDSVKLELDVPERFLGQMRLGQELEISVAAYPKEKFTGQVYYIAARVDPVTRTVQVKALIKNPAHRLRPGMMASLDLTLKIRDEAVLVPEVSLLMNGDRASVYTISPERTAQLTPVTVGLRLAGQAEILSGLKGGEKVIVEGHQKVQPGAKVVLASPERPSSSAGEEPAPNGRISG